MMMIGRGGLFPPLKNPMVLASLKQVHSVSPSSSSSSLRSGSLASLSTASNVLRKKKGIGAVSLDESPSPFYSPGSEILPTLNFSDYENAYRSKTTSNIIKSIWILRLCQYQTVLKNARKLFDTSNAILGKRITNFILKNTFFGHFCAGENKKEVEQMIHHYKENKMGFVLDYAAEFSMEKLLEGPIEEREAAMNQNCEIFLTSFDLSGNKDFGFVPLKTTAICSPVLLQKMTDHIESFQEAWTSLVLKVKGEEIELAPNQEIKDGFFVGKDVQLSEEEFVAALRSLSVKMSDTEFSDLFQLFSPRNGKIGYLEWTAGINLEALLTIDPSKTQNLEAVNLPDPKIRALADQLHHSGHLLMMDPIDSAQYVNFYKRLRIIVEEARKKNIRLMIDAEQTYVQTAIAYIGRHLQKTYNKEKPWVYLTYQCYLLKTKGRLERDQKRAKLENYHFAVKLVRGAYMVEERALAEKAGVASPIINSKSETDYNYNTCIEMLIQNSYLLIASHNEYSCQLAAGLMQKFNISPASGQILFAQLKGMADNLSYILAQNNYPVYKFLPYGQVDLVVKFLIRRIQENNSVTAVGAYERRLMLCELNRRIRQRLKFWKKK